MMKMMSYELWVPALRKGMEGPKIPLVAIYFTVSNNMKR
jgi:hypothetical protein